MLQILSGILVIVGIVGGTLTDQTPETAPAERGGYKVVSADFHVHSSFGDGLLPPFGVVSHARRQGLHALAITDHNQVFGAKLGRWYSRIVGGPTVLVGEEITAPGFHMIGIGLEERVTWRQSAAQTIEAIHRQGGVAIVAHPSRRYWLAFDNETIRELDGAEVMHPRAYRSEGRWEEMRDFYQHSEATANSLTAIGSSDYHWFNSLGICRTYVFVRDNNENEILEAVRAGRTVVYDLEGNMYGEPGLMLLLKEQPVPTTGNYNYASSSFVDTSTRACGWVGLIGLVIAGRRNRVIC